MMEIQEKQANALDLIKTIACIMIVGSHCLPIFENNDFNYYYGQWFFRFCVPLFLLSTGYFFSKMVKDKQKAYIKRIIVLYIISSFVYLPAYVTDSSTKSIISNLLFGYHHLWYLSALAFGLVIVLLVDKMNLREWQYFIAIIMVWGGGLFGTYYQLLNSEKLILLAKIVSVFGGARHALFFAVPLLLFGGLIADIQLDKKIKGKEVYLIVLYILLMAISFMEACFFREQLGDAVRLDVTIFGWMPAVPLTLLGLVVETSIKFDKSRKIRKVTDVVYILHIWVLIAVNKLFGTVGCARFLLVVALSYLLSFFITIVNFKKQNETGN